MDCQPLGVLGLVGELSSVLSVGQLNSSWVEDEATMHAALALVRGKPSTQMLDRVERSLSQADCVYRAGIVAAG
jgi:hypothetical protein